MNSQLQACDRCHRRKTRCDKAHPECGPCGKAGEPCVYSDRTKEPVYRRDVVERLERRAEQLKAANRSLREQLASIQADRHPIGSRKVTEEPRTSQDVANEVSWLSTSAGGDRQYLGSASGVLFASLVRANAAGAITRDAEEASSGSLNIAYPGNVALSRPEWSIDDRALPPQQLAKSLIEAYLAHDHLSYPFLHPKYVRTVLGSIYNDPYYYGKHPFEAFIFNMLLAIGTSQVYKFNWQALPDAETHHLRAMVHLNEVLSQGGLISLQAMLLLCQFRLSSSTKDSSGSLWHLVGIAARICFELGLHREAMYRLKPGMHEQDSESSSISRFEEQEVRRRCFWCVFALDRVVSTTLGRPLAICLEDIDVELPSADLDEAVSPSSASTGGEQASPRITPHYRTAIFTHIVRYRGLCGKFLTSLHRGSRNAVQPTTDIRRLRGELAAEVEAWRADTNLLDLPELDLSSPIAEAHSSFRSKAWYELLYNNGLLLLYRPSPTMPHVDHSEDEMNLQRIFSAAKQSITLYAYLSRSRKINFSWITLHAVFMAGLSYIYAVSHHFREKRRHRLAPTMTPGAQLAKDPTVFEIVNDCRACSNTLVAVSERCNAQKNCHEVFDRLSDAVLADAVESLSMASREPRHSEYRSNPSIPSTSTQRLPTASTPPTTDPAHSVNDYPGSFRLPHEQQLPHGNLHPLTDSAFAQVDIPQSFAAPLAADNALRDCFLDLQGIYNSQWGDDAILQLSMDWLGEIDAGNEPLTTDTIGAGFA